MSKIMKRLFPSKPVAEEPVVSTPVPKGSTQGAPISVSIQEATSVVTPYCVQATYHSGRRHSEKLPMFKGDYRIWKYCRTLDEAVAQGEAWKAQAIQEYPAVVSAQLELDAANRRLKQ